MNWLDSAIALFAPEVALRRVAARARLDLLDGQRGAYAGARREAQTSNWQTSGLSATAALAQALPLLRERASDLERNSAVAGNILDELVSLTVGTGIKLAANTGDPDLDRRIDGAWRRWCDEADADGMFDWHGLQAQAVRAMFERGEALIRRRPRFSSDGLHVPLQIQVMEGDMLSLESRSLEDGGRIVAGVEFDRLDNRRAYWMLAQHPGELVLQVEASD